MRTRPLIIPAFACVAALSACTSSSTVSAGSPTPVTPGTAAPSTPSVAPSATAATSSPATPTPAPTPTPTPTPPAATGPALTGGAAGPFRLGAVYAPKAPAPARWAQSCTAWVLPQSGTPSLLGFPVEGGQKGAIDSIVALAPGAHGPSGIAVGMPVAEIGKREPKSTSLAGGNPAWAVTSGGVRTVYTSWDGGKTVGSIELRPAASAWEPLPTRNPCA